DAMKEQGRGTSSTRAAGFAGSLVLAQVSLSLLLLVAAGLFVRTFVGLADVALGFVTERALVVNVNAQRAAVTPADRYALFERVRDAALAVPGVTHAAIAVITPSSGMQWNNDLEFPDRPDLPEEQRLVNFNYLSPGWFETMGTRLIAGRDFDTRDRLGGTRVVIVNRKFAEKYFGGASPMGKQVRTVARPDEPSVPLEIIGLVGDAVYEGPREPLTPTMYWAMAQEKEATSSVSLTVRTTTSTPAALNRSLTAAITGVHSDLSVSFRPLEDYLDAALAKERLIAMLSGFFGGLSLLLSALGLYGITAYAVIRRRAELGIRMALGASPAGVVRLVMSRTGALVMGGILIGGLASWWASRFVSALLFGVAATDPATTVGAMVLLAIVGALAGWLPARQAAMIDPAEVLRAG
ncbi:MAG: FtsX-like permease family protein, partial [Gemmatimonas sp.]